MSKWSIAFAAFIAGFLMAVGIINISEPGSAAIAIRNNLPSLVKSLSVSGCGYKGEINNLAPNDVALFSHVVDCGDDHYTILVEYSEGDQKIFQEGYLSVGITEYNIFLELEDRELRFNQGLSRINE